MDPIYPILPVSSNPPRIERTLPVRRISREDRKQDGGRTRRDQDDRRRDDDEQGDPARPHIDIDA